MKQILSSKKLREKKKRIVEMVFDKIAFLRKHLQYEEDHIEYEPKELQEMTAAAKEVFKEEKMLIRIKAPIKIFGDVHGQVGSRSAASKNL